MIDPFGDDGFFTRLLHWFFIEPFWWRVDGDCLMGFGYRSSIWWLQRPW